ncbi:adenosine 5'-monophosphoramidase HINT3 isoform X2 [Anabrus simplex]|uniref:adenosine 5'-monophosphoramidase HINT3 isoform X2 n=1 Tax=Anabrus simplex TaxID=316456 RepID=UPI0035A3391D
MSENRDKCVFCRICDGKDESSSNILFQDENYIVIPDIKPLSTHHLLVITRQHIKNAKELTAENKSVVDSMVELGKQVLTEVNGDTSDIRMGFHWPPFHSIAHLHLHVISPTSQLSLKGRLITLPNSWWFVSME